MYLVIYTRLELIKQINIARYEYIAVGSSKFRLIPDFDSRMEFHPAISEPISNPQIALSKHRPVSFTSSLLVLFTNIYESFLLDSYTY